MSNRPVDNLENPVLREVRAVRAAIWAEAAKTPGGIRALMAKEFKKRGIKPKFAKRRSV